MIAPTSYDPEDPEIVAGANDRRTGRPIRDALQQTDKYITGWRKASDPRIPDLKPEQLELAAQTS